MKKKMAAAILAIALGVTLTACGNEAEDTDAGAVEEIPGETVTPVTEEKPEEAVTPGPEEEPEGAVTPGTEDEPKETVTPGTEDEPKETVTPGSKEKPEETVTPEPEEIMSAEAEATQYFENGRSFLYGTDGKEIDLEEARVHFEKAEELGKVEANFYLGVLCGWYHYPQKDYGQAKRYYEECGGYPYAQISLGFLYQNGQGVDKDLEKAAALFQSAIDQGCVEGYLGTGGIAQGEEAYARAFEDYSRVLGGTEQLYIAGAMEQIGCMYENGLGAEPDYQKALEWYEKAAESGSASAMNHIGVLYYDYLGVEGGYETAQEWFERAAELNNASAMRWLGYIYWCQDGYRVSQRALEWYEKAAESGDADAMVKIGNMYYDDYCYYADHSDMGDTIGDAVGVAMEERDYRREKMEESAEKALEWYEKAAESGSADAMLVIGDMYDCGKGVKLDYQRALEWYEKAVESGSASAMNRIGDLYYWGKGVEQDPQRAAEWYEKAAESVGLLK